MTRWQAPGWMPTPQCFSTQAPATTSVRAGAASIPALQALPSGRTPAPCSPSDPSHPVAPAVPPPPAGGDYAECQLQCLRNSTCVAWMHGFNPDPQCVADPVTGQVPPYNDVTHFGCVDTVRACLPACLLVCLLCEGPYKLTTQAGCRAPTAGNEGQAAASGVPGSSAGWPPPPAPPLQPLQGVNGYGCKAGACLLFNGFFNLIEYNAGGRALPGGCMPPGRGPGYGCLLIFCSGSARWPTRRCACPQPPSTPHGPGGAAQPCRLARCATARQAFAAASTSGSACCDPRRTAQARQWAW